MRKQVVKRLRKKLIEAGMPYERGIYSLALFRRVKRAYVRRFLFGTNPNIVELKK